MKLTPNSTARRSTAFATSMFGGGPQTPAPVTRIAPKPSRLTVRSPPMSIVPACLASTTVDSGTDQARLRGGPEHPVARSGGVGHPGRDYKGPMSFPPTATTTLPTDGASGALVGRVWRPDLAGPSVAVLRPDGVYDITATFATV